MNKKINVSILKNTTWYVGVLLLAFMTSTPAVLMAKKSSNHTKADQRAPQQATLTLKKEKQAWQRRKNAMDALQLKNLIEENHKLKVRGQQYQQQLEEKDKKIIHLTNELEKNVQAHAIDHAKPSWSQEQELQEQWDQGIMFKVQIGAYKKRNLQEILENDAANTENFTQETIAGLHHYTLRHFRNYWKAIQFKKALKAMGIPETWIVVFKDGKRIELKEVRSIVLEQKK